jgi:hypothetical protein
MANLQAVLDKIDAYNRQDSNHDMVEGREEPREFVYSGHLTRWVLRLNPHASDILRIAARGQHIGRWTVPRDSYPMNRGGYLRWREDLKKFHAQTVAGYMTEAGYDAADVEHTRAIMLKKNFAADPAAQTLEDALCLVFLEMQFADLRKKTPDDKMVDILRKSWRKMSDQGRTAALTIHYRTEEKALIEKALAD